MPAGPLCEAIRSRRLLAFNYNGHGRVVAPYCHGFSQSGEALRAVQVDGSSTTVLTNDGKLWLVAKMRGLRVLDRTFVPDDPNYNPSDSAMTRICCRVTALRLVSR